MFGVQRESKTKLINSKKKKKSGVGGIGMNTYKRSLPRGSWMEDPEGR